VVDGKAKTASGVKAIDDKTLEVTLDAPIAYFLALLTYADTFVVPQKLVESGANWQESAYGTGPYKVKEWKRGQSILLEANPNYWQGQPGIPKILMPFTKDSETAYQRRTSPMSRASPISNRRRSSPPAILASMSKSRRSIMSMCGAPSRWRSINRPSPTKCWRAGWWPPTGFCQPA
jgi:MarR-like DNA-binding transcriptional regulator SgrR of sgrS sRNA